MNRLIVTAEAKKRLKYVLAIGLSTVAVLAIASQFIQIGGNEDTLTAARGRVRAYLASPDAPPFPVQGNRELLKQCVEPKVENHVVIHPKLRYDFKVTCKTGVVGYITVLWRYEPPVIGISANNPIVAEGK